MRIFEVGGCVRDEVMGRTANDIDFTVVLEDADFPAPGTTVADPDPFALMEAKLAGMGFKVFTRNPEFLTVRARFPREAGVRGFNVQRTGLTADFVLARKESDYTDGRRPDVVEPGTLEDDLRRRDFTMNAIAKDPLGNLIDPFGGIADINNGVVRAVGHAFDRFNEDALRAVRALRFAVTLDFRIDPEVEFAMETEAVLEKIRNNIATDRIRVELDKMTAADTMASIRILNKYSDLSDALFSHENLTLMPTVAKRK